MSTFLLLLSAACAACATGLIWKIIQALRARVDHEQGAGFGARLGAVVTSVPMALHPRHLAALVRDALFQIPIARNGALRWVMHALIFFGFMGLLVMHALDEPISERWFPDYAPPLDPYQWLRNLFGVMAVIGLAIAAARRLALPLVRRTTGWRDWLFWSLIAAIMLSGFVLEAAKIVSPAVYQRMLDDYSPTDDEEELAALRYFWATEYGMVFPDTTEGNTETLALGREVNDSSCAGCHSPTPSAFVSYPLAKAFAPAAPALSAVHADILLYWFHVLACFLGIALLPWGKFLHPLSTPINLTARAGFHDCRTAQAPPARAALLRGLGIESCTHCGACSEQCSVSPSFIVLGNPNVLPSEKLSGLKRFAANRLSGLALSAFAEGSRICTECLRCTTVCPAGIDLQDLWLTSKRRLAAEGPGDAYADLAAMPAAQRVDLLRTLPPAATETGRAASLSDNRQSFWGCVQCTTCTSVCPVVAASSSPGKELHLTPQQIMNMLRMGQKEQAMAAEMTWSCVTCYKCQEHCPQNVLVADVLYELRNLAAARLRAKAMGRKAEGKS